VCFVQPANFFLVGVVWDSGPCRLEAPLHCTPLGRIGAPIHHIPSTGSTAGSAVNRWRLPADSETRFTAAATAVDLAMAFAALINDPLRQIKYQPLISMYDPVL